MTHNQSKARTATVTGLARLAGLAAITGAEAITADSVTLCAPPADARLVGLCADLTEIEQWRQSRLAGRCNFPAVQLGGLLAQRQLLIADVCETKAATRDGLKAKARAVRLVLGDAVVPRNMREALMRSLLEDMRGGLL
ncbi:hypothetical protein [Gluconobacter morbifer]|uniref:hypothetical protein n=1 Tax=Gluconobacter morbifer TaxID=479935 RepID=UPI0002E260AE|nr:hypothetical protein [Gluconobacter morbifer]